MKLAVLCAVVAALAVAQDTAQVTGAIEGMVVNKVTGAGIGDAAVRFIAYLPNPATGGLTQPSSSTSAVVLKVDRYETRTDETGAFRIPGVKPNDYSASVEKSGYFPVDTEFVLFSGDRPKHHVEAGGDPLRVRLELNPPAMIRGRVIGADGNPARAEVDLGRGRTANTDAEGSFAFDNLEPGPYTLLAHPKTIEPVSKPEGNRTEVVPTYYPSVVDPTQAESIVVRAGAELSGYEIRLQSVPVYRVRGVVLNPDGKPAAKAVVELRARVAGENPDLFLMIPGGAKQSFSIQTSRVQLLETEEPFVTGDDGAFEFPSVPAGDWTVRAEGDPVWDDVRHTGVSSVASAAFSLGHGDPDDLKIQMAAPPCTSTPSFGGLLSQTCTGGLGLNGAIINRQFPRFVVTNQGFGGAATAGTGGMNSLGPFVQGPSKERRPSGVANATWVRGNHTYKAGGEWRLERYPATSYTGATGQYTFDPNSTMQTALDGVGGFSTGVYGFGFASFLRGDVTNFFIEQPGSVSGTKKQLGLFVQDTWKVTRKLTLDYGLRWDYATYGREEHGLNPNFSATTPNPSAGGHPGAQIYEQTCNCHFAENYPYAIGPRIGVAYQINSKTVLRGGFGVVYAATVAVGGTVAANTDTTSTPGFGQWVGQLQGGIPSTLHPIFPNLTPNAGQGIGAVVGAPSYLDPNSDRPARQYQYSISVQRELNRNLVLEASFVGSRGIWWPASALTAANAISVDTLTKYGFTVGNPADAALLTPQIGSLTATQRSTLAARGVNLPYSNFPGNQTVLQSLYPFPQYLAPSFFGAPSSGPNLSPTNAPLGKTWYDSLQLNLTKRFSHGLTFNANYTYSKNLDLMSSPDIFNRGLGKNLSANDLPHQLRASIQYNTPRIKGPSAVLSNKIVSNVLSDWTLGTYLQYQSAPILARPNSSGLVPINQYLGRGPGPAQLKIGADGNPMNPWSVDWTDYSGVHHTDPIDINCHCFDPTKTQVLNPNAWTNVPDGQWANDFSSLRYYRGFRYPTENLNVGRTFRIKERVTLNVRVEFSNAFNRTQLPQPNTGGGFFQSFGSLITKQVGGPYDGLINGGFGSVVPLSGTANSRTGLFVGRLQF